MEKKVVSDIAIAGCYYFKTAGIFFEAAKKAIINQDQINGAYFITAALNQVILSGENVYYSMVDEKKYHSLYSPEAIETFNETAYARRLRGKRNMEPINVIIPAAGEGSRFAKAGWKKPKPFLDVDGRPMIEHVIDNVAPAGSKPTLLLRKAHVDAHPDIASKLKRDGHSIRVVDELTEGTACTVLLARDMFDDDTPMMVANSDQLVDFDCADYVKDCLDRDLDGSILVFKDKHLDPKWSFAKVNQNNLVTEVAEKKAISEWATVGIYFFRRGSDFVSAAVDMIARNERVNNEFYTCPVYNYMIKMGLRIGIYEVQFEDMKGLGIPDDLTNYLKEIDAPESADAP